MKLSRLIAAVYGAEWAIVPEKLLAIADVLEFQANGGQLSAAEVRERIGPSKTAPVSGQGIAILPLYGILAHRANQVDNMSGPGGTSTEKFAAQFDAMLGDPAIAAIVIDVDSPGGAVPGTPELARRIFEARGTKPIVAYVNSLAASAAYWIASACDAIWITESGDVGSIGVYALHIDESAADEQMGLKTTLISAGKYKVEGNPHEPLSEAARDAMQERVDGFYADFTKSVAIYRGVEHAVVMAGFGEGRIVRARQAVKAGMADKVGTLDQLLSKLGAGKGSRARLTAATQMPVLTAGTPISTVLAAGTLTETTPALVDAEPIVVPLHTPAPVAKEQPMPEQAIEVPAGADTAADKAAQKTESKRVKDLMALAREHKVPVEKASTWIEEGISLEFAQKHLLDEIKAKAAAAPVVTSTARVIGGSENGTGPFRTLGEQLVAGALLGMGKADDRTRNLLAAASGASATVGTDGGFLIQKEFTTELLESAFKAGDILSRVDSTEVGATSDGLEVVYLDETSRATGSRWGGVQVYRAAEADAATGKKPQLGKWECRLEDIIGLAYITERLLQDAPAMQDVFEKGFTEEFTFKAEDEIWRGTGSGQMLGILTALYSSTAGQSLGPTISVAKETGQAADTAVFENIEKMWLRVHPRSRAKGAWFINIEVEPQLAQMQVGTGVSGQLVYMPPGGISGAPYGTLKGRPVIPCEYASGLGDVGDIVFADFSRYKVITKGGLQSDESMHVRFLNNERTFRWVSRINGKPKDKTAITPYMATDTTLRLSPLVTLAAR